MIEKTKGERSDTLAPYEVSTWNSAKSRASDQSLSVSQCSEGGDVIVATV